MKTLIKMATLTLSKIHVSLIENNYKSEKIIGIFGQFCTVNSEK